MVVYVLKWITLKEQNNGNVLVKSQPLLLTTLAMNVKAHPGLLTRTLRTPTRQY